MSLIREMLAEPGTMEQQWRVLRVLSEYGELDSSGLADRSNLLSPSLKRIAMKMRDKSLITQTRDNKGRRKQIIGITRAGQKIIGKQTAQTAQIVADFRDTLGDKNYDQLLDLLAILDPDSHD